MYLRKFKVSLQTYLGNLLTIHTSPHEIAVGFAIGIFIAIIPTPGFNLLLGALIVFLYPKISKISLFGAMALLNPLTLVPFYALSLSVGATLFENEPVVEVAIPVFTKVLYFTRRFLVGSIIVGSVTAAFGYMAMYFTVRTIQQRKKSTE